MPSEPKTSSIEKYRRIQKLRFYEELNRMTMAQLRRTPDQWKTKQLSFAVRATSFVNRAIKMRQMIIRKDKSRKSDKEVNSALNYLSAWFGAPINSTRAATLIINHYHKVVIILPGQSAKNHESMMRELQMLINEASSMLEGHTAQQLQQA